MRKKSSKRRVIITRTPLSELGGLRGVIIFIFVLSGIVNLLALTGSFYMMQVYDRVVPTGGVRGRV